VKFKAHRTHVTPCEFAGPDPVIEMRWVEGDQWMNQMAVPDANWKDLCWLARRLKRDFIRHLAIQANIDSSSEIDK
jgi:hypothetical protein